MKIALLVLPLFLLSVGGGNAAEATTKTQDAAMEACLRFAHAKDLEKYCSIKRGTKIQKECVAKADGKEAKRACLVKK